MIRIPTDIDKYIDDVKRLETINDNKKVVAISFTKINVNKDGLEQNNKDKRNISDSFDDILEAEIKKYL